MASGLNDNWLLDGQGMEMVNDITYLGANINCFGDVELDIKQRIQRGKSAMTRLRKIWRAGTSKS